MDPLVDFFFEFGAEQRASANRPFFLNDPSIACFVVSGGVDIFAVRIVAGEPGSRRFLTHLSAGQVLLSVGQSGDDHMEILAVPEQETLLSHINVSKLRTAVRHGHVASALASAIERWIATFSSVIAPSAEPKGAVPLSGGTERSLAAKNTARATRGIVWVRQLEGVSHFLSSPEHQIGPETGWVPLTTRTWIEASDAGTCATATTADLLEDGSLWQGIERFHGIIKACVVRAEISRQTAERERIQRQQESDQSAMGGAIAHLASAMDEESRLTAVRTGELDPLVTACELVGQEIGIEITDTGGGHQDRPTGERLNRLLRASRVRARRVALRDEWWKRDNGPLLGFLEDDETPIALIPRSDSAYEAVDPSAGTRVQVDAAQANKMSSFAFMFYRPFPAQVLTAWQVLKFAFRASPFPDVATMLAVSVAVGLLALFTPIATGIIIDTIIPSGERRVLLQLVLALTVMMFGTGLFQLTRSLAVLRMESKMAAAVQAGVWDRLLTLPPSFFRDYLAGDLASRSLGIDSIRRLLTGAAVSSLLGGVFSVFSFALLFYYSWKLALVATGLVLVAVAATLFAGVREVRLERALLKVQGRIEGLVLQFITGVSKLRVAGAEARAFAVWAREFTEQRRLAFRAQSVENGLQVFNAAFPVVASMFIFGTLVFFMGGTGVGSEGSLSTGSFLAFNAAFGQFFGAAIQMSGVVLSLLSAVPLYERAKPILDTVPEVDVAKTPPGELSGAIELSHVSFRYHADGPLVLDDVSIQAQSGEFVAIVGPSGAGKSSVFRLLLGFETPESGSVYYDGQDLATLDVQAVRRQTGVVLQNAQVLPGTVFENIVGSAQLTHEDAAEAARMAGLDQDIEQMPMGMHTFIVEGGGTLSGGQRQRLLIARAVVGKPRILLFDEATSALDNRTQAHVSNSLGQLNTTRVVVAHRLSTIINADRIYVMDKGSVVQVGTYEELMSRDGLFADLARRQVA